MDLTQAIYARLVGDAELVSMLAEYEGLPAVFTDENVPENATLPFAWTSGEVAAVPDDTKLQEGRQIMRDIGFYARRTGSAEEVEAIAERGRALFHRHAIAISDSRTIVAWCSGPVVAPTDNNVIGRIVTVHLRIEKN